MSIKPAAAQLPVSDMTIRRWERDGLLPEHFTIGRTSFWRAMTVGQYVARLAAEAITVREAPSYA
ncbi:MAG: hypothetical protein WA706_25110, partial [Pseudolabrys sp.]